MIKINDTIKYRDMFGRGMLKEAKVEAMELTSHPRAKDGVPVFIVGKDSVRANKVVFSLDDGHWCYSDQVVLDK
jgi:hypothetical protein